MNAKQWYQRRVQISIEMDISQFEKKPKGSVVLRQVAWGKNRNEAKNESR
eukprot:TRINITY_DN4420_c0_g1_i1.p2 TRINITY_DN4420_c0_g1~~TRINITY_DN4420_c0_g1_i1.p2  ORF type:complete len:50 (+),score=19.16 TRINITY_DN4420_c0_g1_i1:19-168(+)